MRVGIEWGRVGRCDRRVEKTEERGGKRETEGREIGKGWREGWRVDLE